MAIHGNTVLIYRGSTLLGGTKVNRVKTDVDLEEVSSATQATWKEYKTMRKGWSFTVNYLVLTGSVLGQSSTGIRDVLQVGNSFSLIFKNRGNSTTDSTGVSGTGILKTCDIQAAVNGLVTGTFTFTGTGSLT